MCPGAVLFIYFALSSSFSVIYQIMQSLTDQIYDIKSQKANVCVNICPETGDFNIYACGGQNGATDKDVICHTYFTL
jgi:hypothetical protein